MRYIMFIGLFTFLLAGTQAFALPRSGTIDQNGDGLITWEEFQVAFPGVTQDHFTEIDTNKNGTLDEQEMSVFRNRFGGSRPNGVRGGMGGGTPLPQQNEHKEGDGHSHQLPVLPSKKK